MPKTTISIRPELTVQDMKTAFERAFSGTLKVKDPYLGFVMKEKAAKVNPDIILEKNWIVSAGVKLRKTDESTKLEIYPTMSKFRVAHYLFLGPIGMLIWYALSGGTKRDLVNEVSSFAEANFGIRTTT